MIPSWLHVLSIAWLAIGAGCALAIAVDLFRRPQQMWIMNVVWPVTALFGLVVILWFYLRYGRLAARSKVEQAKQRGDEPPSRRLTPFPLKVAKGTLHCGAGCTLGDIVAETVAHAFPLVAVWLGWKTLFAENHKLFAVWILDYILAFVFGIAFQYFTIKPMRDLSAAEGLVQAFKADTLSLTAWQVGMYGFMALAYFWLFGTLLQVRLDPGMVEFWFMMQLAMLCGFATSYPVNWWLLRKGIKEAM